MANFRFRIRQLAGSLLITCFFLISFESKVKAQFIGGGVGISVGAESIFGFKGHGRIDYFHKKDFRLYTSVEGSFYMFFAFWYNLNIANGIEYKVFGLEQSFGFWHAIYLDPNPGVTPPIGPSKHFTFTPKICLRFHQYRQTLQLKIGSSYFLKTIYKTPDWPVLDLGRISPRNLNFEILATGLWER